MDESAGEWCTYEQAGERLRVSPALHIHARTTALPRASSTNSAVALSAAASCSWSARVRCWSSATAVARFRVRLRARQFALKAHNIALQSLDVRA
jgi:hypothetical protein